MLLLWLIAGAALLNSVNSWVPTNEEGAVDSRYVRQHTAEFEASVDRGLVDAQTRMDLTDRDWTGTRGQS